MVNNPNIEAFTAALAAIAPDLEVTIDAPAEASGEFWIDIVGEQFSTSLSFRPNVGFGVYVSGDEYGERPDEVFKSPEKTARRVHQLSEQVHKVGAPKPMGLSDMRVLVGMTQNQVAAALCIKQPSVQRIENRRTVRLDTLANYVQAMGGRLEMSVVFDDMEARVELPAVKEAV